MMRVLKLSSAAVLTLLSMPAGAVTITFDEFTTLLNQPSVVTQGYTFSAGAGTLVIKTPDPTICSPDCAENGTSTLIYGAANGSTPTSVPPLVLNTTGSFRLLGFDLAEFLEGTDLNATQLQVVGSLVGGGTITQTIQLDGFNDGRDPGVDFQSVTLNSLFGSSFVTSVAFSGFDSVFTPRGFALDNIQLAAAPEPATWAMMIGGLGLVGGTLRRRTVKLAPAA